MDVNSRYNPDGTNGPNVIPESGNKQPKGDGKLKSGVSDIIAGFKQLQYDNPLRVLKGRAKRLQPDKKMPIPQPPGLPPSSPKSPEQQVKQKPAGPRPNPFEVGQKVPEQQERPIPAGPRENPFVKEKTESTNELPVFSKPKKAEKPLVPPRPARVLSSPDRANKKSVDSENQLVSSSLITNGPDQVSKVKTSSNQPNIKVPDKLSKSITEFIDTQKKALKITEYSLAAIDGLMAANSAKTEGYTSEQLNKAKEFLEFFNEEEKKGLVNIKQDLEKIQNFYDELIKNIESNYDVNQPDKCFKEIGILLGPLNSFGDSISNINNFFLSLDDKRLKNSDFQEKMKEYSGLFETKMANFTQPTDLGLMSQMQYFLRLGSLLDTVGKSLSENSQNYSTLNSFREETKKIFEVVNSKTKKRETAEDVALQAKDVKFLRDINKLLNNPQADQKIKLRDGKIVFSGGRSQIRSYSKGGVDALEFIFNRMNESKSEKLDEQYKGLYQKIKALSQMKSELEHPKIKKLIDHLDEKFGLASDSTQDYRNSITSVSDNESTV